MISVWKIKGFHFFHCFGDRKCDRYQSFLIKDELIEDYLLIAACEH